MVNIDIWVCHIKEHSIKPLDHPFWLGQNLEKCWFWKTGISKVDIARFDMDIAHFETTMAFLQNLVYFKVCIPLCFSKMASTGLSVE